MKISRNPESVHPPLAGYSHQIELSGSERLLAMSGQVGMSVTGEVPEYAADQFELALSNVVRNLEAAGMGPADLVKLTFYLTEMIAAERRAEVIGECTDAEGRDRRLGQRRPSRLVAAAKLPPEAPRQIGAPRGWTCVAAG
jgi:2-iminobutanoate/2-iminopropanoate deaminase